MEYVASGGLEIAYERVGAGPPLVLAHGAGDDGRIWRSQRDRLADELTVVCWDEPGAGRSSDVPGGFTLEGYAGALAAVVRDLGLGPAHLAGLSWGGTVTLAMYRAHPELVATLVLIDTYAGWKGSLPAEEVRSRVESLEHMLRSPTPGAVSEPPGMFAGDPPPGARELLATVGADVRLDTLRCQLPIMANADLTDLLPQVAVPTLLIWGEGDVRSPVRVAHEFHRAITGAELVLIPGAGHLSPLEKPDAVNDAIRTFCRAHPPSPAEG